VSPKAESSFDGTAMPSLSELWLVARGRSKRRRERFGHQIGSNLRRSGPLQEKPTSRREANSACAFGLLRHVQRATLNNDGRRPVVSFEATTGTVMDRHVSAAGGSIDGAATNG
jgi:hypothetical protein